MSINYAIEAHAGAFPYSDSRPALAVVSEVISDYADHALVDGAGFSPIGLGHKILNALVESGHCAMSAPPRLREEAKECPAAWVTRLPNGYQDAMWRYREARDHVRRDGFVVKGSAGGMVKSPYFQIMRAALEDMEG